MKLNLKKNFEKVNFSSFNFENRLFPFFVCVCKHDLLRQNWNPFVHTKSADFYYLFYAG